MRYRPLPTHEVAKLCGVTVWLLIDWRKRGKLSLAPRGSKNPVFRAKSEAIWSAAAVQEAVEYSNRRKPKSPPNAQSAPEVHVPRLDSDSDILISGEG